MPTLSRNAQVLRYILQVAPGIGHTKLAKYAYLADLEALRYLGRPVSRFHYVWDKHGPFDSRGFFAARRELLNGEYITENKVDCGGYTGYEMMPTSQAVDYGFPVAEAAVLDYAATTYLAKTARELCDEVVYSTEPMRAAKPGKPLPMGKVKRRKTVPRGFNLERMLAGEASAKSGRVRPLARVIDGLRARAC